MEGKILDQQKRIGRLREMLLNGDIQPIDYNEMKQGVEHQLVILQEQSEEKDKHLKDMENKLDKALG